MVADVHSVQVDSEQDMALPSDILMSHVFEVHMASVVDTLGSTEVVLDTREMDSSSLVVMMDILTTLAWE